MVIRTVLGLWSFKLPVRVEVEMAACVIEKERCPQCRLRILRYD